MNNRIEQTKDFLCEKLKESEFFKEHPSEREYRLEHSYRVANIGKEIAQAEGMDVEAMIIGCLLHDVSYCTTFDDENNKWVDHGRNSAKIARPFLTDLGFEGEKLENICYGIAIHVDDAADFDGTKNAFAMTIGEADNIDRFDAYRIFETLRWVKYNEMTRIEKLEHVTKTITQLQKLKEIDCATKTGKQMWLEKLDFQLVFFEKLKRQIELSELES